MKKIISTSLLVLGSSTVASAADRNAILEALKKYCVPDPHAATCNTIFEGVFNSKRTTAVKEGHYCDCTNNTYLKYNKNQRKCEPYCPNNLLKGSLLPSSSSNCKSGSGKISLSSVKGNVSFCCYCSAGTYSDGKSECKDCKAGTYSKDYAGSCTQCKAGTFSSKGSSSCYPCSSGYWSSAGAGSCTPCPAGTYSTGSASSCTNCLTTGVTSCSPTTGKATSCKAGYGFNSTIGTCSQCSPGFYSAGGTSGCLTCSSNGSALDWSSIANCGGKHSRSWLTYCDGYGESSNKSYLHTEYYNFGGAKASNNQYCNGTWLLSCSKDGSKPAASKSCDDETVSWTTYCDNDNETTNKSYSHSYTYSHGSCKEKGQYCSSGSCKTCSSPPTHAKFTTVGTCDWDCESPFIKSSTTNTCICGDGYKLSGNTCKKKQCHVVIGSNSFYIDVGDARKTVLTTNYPTCANSCDTF